MVLFCFNKNKHLPETSNKKTYTTRTWDGKPKQHWRMKAFHNLCWFFPKIKRKLQAKASTTSKRSNSNALQLCHAIATLLPQDLQCHSADVSLKVSDFFFHEWSWGSRIQQKDALWSPPNNENHSKSMQIYMADPRYTVASWGHVCFECLRRNKRDSFYWACTRFQQAKALPRRTVEFWYLKAMVLPPSQKRKCEDHLKLKMWWNLFSELCISCPDPL